MAVEWPADLPQCPILENLTYKPEPNVSSFKPDVGPALVYPRAGDSGAMSVFTFLMTRAQVIIFDAYFRNDLLFGTNNFLMSDPISHDTEEFQILPESPPEYQWKSPGKFLVSLQVYRLPASLSTGT